MSHSSAKLVIRPATSSDAKAIAALSAKVYGKSASYSQAQIRGQVNNFPEGQFVAEYEGKIVGHCATLIVPGEIALAPHTWAEITGGGFASRHDSEGDVLYGMEVCVDPDFRRLRIGQRFYRKRQELCQYFELKGIVFAGRMPGYARRKKEFPNPQDYLEAVIEKQVRDPVINFQMSLGFQPRAMLPDYL
ncbi:MAG: GNAT family N-acetyltransferase, partial [Sphingomonadales bacterium]|nr:GNAT family N-acetyltransferase [Sphingomonadales bacterium]MBU3991609.1 GNAT family N-acetyltransferase [Alphaproteobacteria bacterium]